MKIQASSNQTKICVHCSGIVTQSERRKVDGRMHKHLVCPKEVKSSEELKEDADEELFWRLFLNKVEGGNHATNKLKVP